MNSSVKNILLWTGALVVGAVLGLFGIGWLDAMLGFVATVYTRLFQLLAVPVIALAVITTLSSLGAKKDTGRIFARTLVYTLSTTFCAALVGLGLYLLIAPGNLPGSALESAAGAIESAGVETTSYYDHILGVIPNNIINPFLSGNVLSVLLLSASIGLALAFMPKNENVEALMKVISGIQEVFFVLIKALVWSLPLGIVAFSSQLSSQLVSGVAVGSLGKYVAVILGGNAIQFFVVLPLFLLMRGLNPVKVLKAMSPAVLMALFTKSSAATLPVPMSSAENNLGVRKEVSRFVLPICTTINMNGCAAFILVTSMFVMQNGGMTLSIGTMLLWVLIAVFSAVGNAGVPMGCYFLTLSLMSGMGVPVAIMGIILPVYTIIDMIETAENVWSDSCVCAMTNKDLYE